MTSKRITYSGLSDVFKLTLSVFEAWHGYPRSIYQKSHPSDIGYLR